MRLHRDVDPESSCGGQVADGQELFRTDYWCVYCGAKWSDKQLDTDTRYAVTGYPGVAFTYLGKEMQETEDTVWSGYLQETGLVRVVMVGDDRVHVVDPDDLTALDDEDYCASCGQVGCTADGR